jgi:hypothetical protein
MRMLKTTIGVIIAAVLIMSILPASIADEDTPNSADDSSGQGQGSQNQISLNRTDDDDDDNETEDNDDNDDSDDNDTDDDFDDDSEQERIRERLKEIQENRIERLKELKEKPEWAKYNESMGWKARIVDRIELEKARANYLQAKERFIVKKADLEQSKIKFKEKQELKRLCREQGEGTCNVTDEQLLSASKNFLGNSADAIIEHLNKVKTKVQENDDLSEEEVKA